jgi:hypothetical protein
MEVLEWMVAGIEFLFDFTDIAEGVYELAARGYRRVRGEPDDSF